MDRLRGKRCRACFLLRPQKQKKLLLATTITALLASSTVFLAPAATTTRAPCPRKSRAHPFSSALTPNLASGLSVDLKNGKNEIQIPFFDLSPSAASDTSYHKNYSRESRLTHRWPHSDVPVYSLTTREQESSELPPCSPLLRSISSNSLCDVPMCTKKDHLLHLKNHQNLLKQLTSHLYCITSRDCTMSRVGSTQLLHCDRYL